MTIFAWSALLVFTLATAALLVLLGKALFHALDRVDRVRDELRAALRRDMREILDGASTVLPRGTT